MSTAIPNFRFQRFTVWHDKCAMKVGTDGVLIGAWCPLPAMNRVRALDIGTGSGLIALMLAQRLEDAGKDFHVQGIDINHAAVTQAVQNFKISPWTDRLTCVPCALQEFQSTMPFQLIVSNPPYFQDSLKNPDPAKADARHTDKLTYSQLLHGAASLLSDDGTFAVILPATVESDFLTLAAWEGLLPVRITRVHPKPKKPAKRVMIALQKVAMVGPVRPKISVLHIESATAPRSEEYARLTKDFYLQQMNYTTPKQEDPFDM